MAFGERYRLVRTLKRGGMAEVLEAIAFGGAGFQRRVAIKRLLPELAQDESAVRSFIDEAQIVSRLHHANIVTVLDFGMMDDCPFQALELIEGIDLSTLSDRAEAQGRAIPPELAAHIVAEVAHALAHAHAAVDDHGEPLGVVHRDVSPANVLVSWGGDVKLADFGIALARHRLEETRAGIWKGKPSFMAPEQLLGKEVDGRTDLFGLGCVLHFLLTGRTAVVRAEPGQVGQVRIDPRCPEDLARIILKATVPDRAGRYSSASTMAADCGRAAAARILTDARTTLCELMSAIKQNQKVTPARGGADGLLNVELLLDVAAPKMRRFSTVMPPAQEVEESTRPTAVSWSGPPPPMFKPEASTTLPISTIATAMPTPTPSITATPLVPTPTAGSLPLARVERLSAPPRLLLMWGLSMVMMAMAGAGLMWLYLPHRETPAAIDPVIDEPLAPTAIARQAPEPEPVPEVASEAVKLEPEEIPALRPIVNRTIRKPAAPPSTPSPSLPAASQAPPPSHDRLLRELAARGLSPADYLPTGASKDLAAQIADAQRLSIDVPLLERKLKRVEQTLRAISAKITLVDDRAELGRLEGLYLDLRSQVVPSLGAAECAALARRGTQLEQAVSVLRRKLPE